MCEPSGRMLADLDDLRSLQPPGIPYFVASLQHDDLPGVLENAYDVALGIPQECLECLGVIGAARVRFQAACSSIAHQLSAFSKVPVSPDEARTRYNEEDFELMRVFERDIVPPIECAMNAGKTFPTPAIFHVFTSAVGWKGHLLGPLGLSGLWNVRSPTEPQPVGWSLLFLGLRQDTEPGGHCLDCCVAYASFVYRLCEEMGLFTWDGHPVAHGDIALSALATMDWTVQSGMPLLTA